MDSLIITPDENFIADFVRKEAEMRARPASLAADAHVDLPHYLMHHAGDRPFGDLEQGPFTLEKAREACLRLFCSALYCEDRFNGEASLKNFEALCEFTLNRIEPAAVIRSGGDLARVLEDPETIGTLLLVENADFLADDAAYAEELRSKGARIVGLTHAGRNRLADGNAVRFSDGLSREGKAAVRALRDNGLVIDVAHLHSACLRQLLRMDEGLLVASHTGIRNLSDTPRNLDLEQIREVLQRGGMIGITFNPEMLSPDGKAGMEDVFAHMDTVVQRFGPGGVGIGSDFCGFDSPAEGLEDISKISALGKHLLARGYGKEAVEGIMGTNWIALFKRLLA